MAPAWVSRLLRRSGVRERASETGSVLALVPAAFLVLVLLAALAVDSAVAYQAQGQMHDALTAAANDAVAAGLSNARFYSGQGVGLDPVAAAQVVCQSVDSQGASSLHGMQVSMAISGDSILVAGTATVDAVFGRALPGFGTRTVRSSAEATLSSGSITPAAAFPSPAPISCGP